MANSKVGFMVSYILLSIIIFHVTFSAQGRPLKSESKDQNQNMATEKTATYADATTMNAQYDAVGKWTVDDFQPTDPGHSPGAGHSSPGANVVPKP
ncbi:hypothetical protein RJT34_08639 [Clitoria ternatea]|uniref:Encoded peptide n=1 Tax=Clitoria ternatea TaxID=43366 RepID=A0AAN9K5Z3_CLITE